MTNEKAGGKNFYCKKIKYEQKKNRTENIRFLMIEKQAIAAVKWFYCANTLRETERVNKKNKNETPVAKQFQNNHKAVT